MKPLIAVEAVEKIPNWVLLSGAAVVVLYFANSGGLKDGVAGAVAGLIKAGGKIVFGAAVGLKDGVQAVTVGAAVDAGRSLGSAIRDAVGAPPLNIIKCKLAIAQGANGEAYTYCEPEIFSRWQFLSVRQKLTGKTFTMSDIFN